MSDFRPLIERAVSQKGSQQALAEAMGCTQQHISYLLNEAKRVSAETAIAIDRATDGAVSRHSLRPDIFPSEGQAA